MWERHIHWSPPARAGIRACDPDCRGTWTPQYVEGSSVHRAELAREMFVCFYCSVFMALPFSSLDVRGSSKTAGKLQSSAPTSWSCPVWKWRKWRFAKIKKRFTSKYEGTLIATLFKKSSSFSNDFLLRICRCPRHPLEGVFTLPCVYSHRRTWLVQVGLFSSVCIHQSEWSIVLCYVNLVCSLNSNKKLILEVCQIY